MLFLVNNGSVKVYGNKPNPSEWKLHQKNGLVEAEDFNWLINHSSISAYNKAGNLIKETQIDNNEWYFSKGDSLVVTEHFQVLSRLGLNHSILNFEPGKQIDIEIRNSRIERIVLDPRICTSLELGESIGQARYSMDLEMTRQFLGIHDFAGAKLWIKEHFRKDSFEIKDLVLSCKVYSQVWQVSLLGPACKQPVNPLTLLQKLYGFAVLKDILPEDSYLKIASGGPDGQNLAARDYLNDRYFFVTINTKTFPVPKDKFQLNLPLLIFQDPKPESPAKYALDYLLRQTTPLESSLVSCGLEIPLEVSYLAPTSDGYLKVVGSTDLSEEPVYSRASLSDAIEIKSFKVESREVSKHVFCSGIGGNSIENNRGIKVSQSVYLTKPNNQNVKYLRSVRESCTEKSKIIIATLTLCRNINCKDLIAKAKVDFETYIWDTLTSNWILSPTRDDGLTLLLPSSFNQNTDNNFLYLVQKQRTN